MYLYQCLLQLGQKVGNSAILSKHESDTAAPGILCCCSPPERPRTKRRTNEVPRMQVMQSRGGRSQSSPLSSIQLSGH